MKASVLFALMFMILCAGCTQQQVAKNFGGSVTTKLSPGRKLLNVTWKEPSSLWILTRQRHQDEAPETYKFQESASWGLMEGTVTLVEQ